MSGKAKSASANLLTDYCEESIKIPALITIVLLAIICIPLTIRIYRIDAAGKMSTDISKYQELVEVVGGDLQMVSSIVNNDSKELAALNAARAAGTVRLIVPEVVIVERRSADSQKRSTLNIDIDGIYWSAANPLVTINGETYHEGDTIQNYTITKIDKRSIRFEDQNGTVIEKDIYENLLYNE